MLQCIFSFLPPHQIGFLGLFVSNIHYCLRLKGSNFLNSLSEAKNNGYDYVYNVEALRDVDEKMVAEFLRAQVEILGGGDQDLKASVKDIKVIKDIKDLQKKLYK